MAEAWPGQEVNAPAKAEAWPGQELPAQPAKPLGTLDYLTRKLTQVGGKMMQGASIVGGGLAGAVGMDDLRDQAFDLSTNYGKFGKDAEIGVGTNDAAQSMPQRIAGAGVQAIPALAAFVANPALGLGLVSDLSMADSGDLISGGVDAKTAGKVFATDVAGNAVGMLPFVGPALGPTGNTLARRVISGAAANAFQGGATDAAKQSILYGNGYEEQAKQYDPLNPEARIVDLLLGGGTGVHTHYSPEARAQRQSELGNGRFQTPEEVQNIRRTYNQGKWGIGRTDGYGPELAPLEPAAPRATEPYAADPYAVNPKQATAELNAKLFPTPDEAPDLKLVPKVGDGALFSTKSNPDPASIPSKLTLEDDGPNRILSDGDARNIEKVLGMSEAEVTALPRPAQEALRDHANSFAESKQSFDIADRRQRQADADLANNGQIDPDYQGGGAAARGGAFDAGIRRVTLLDGELPVTLMDSDGKKATVAIDQNGKQILVEVDPKRITEHDLPANQRMAQDFNARSSEPPSAVGRGTMASESMPRRSTDRIAGDQYGGRATPYNPTPLDGGRVSGDVLPPDAGTSVVPGARREGDTVNGETLRPFDAPNEQRQIGAPPRQIGERSRFATDEQGRTVDRENRQPLAGEGRPLTPRPEPARLQESQQPAPQFEQPAGDAPAPKSEPTPAKPVAESQQAPAPKAGDGKVATAQDGAASDPKAYPQDQATKLASSMTKKGLPSEAYPHPTVDGQYAIRARGEPAAKDSLTPVETVSNVATADNHVVRAMQHTKEFVSRFSDDKRQLKEQQEFTAAAEKKFGIEKIAGYRGGQTVHVADRSDGNATVYLRGPSGDFHEAGTIPLNDTAVYKGTETPINPKQADDGEVAWRASEKKSAQLDDADGWIKSYAKIRKWDAGDVENAWNEYVLQMRTPDVSETDFKDMFRNRLDSTTINPDQKGASLGQEKTPQEVLTKTAPKEADPTAGIPKGMFTKVKDVEYDAGSGKKVGTAKEAMRDLNRSLSDYQAFLDCLRG
jgi:hypothetical protein